MQLFLNSKINNEIDAFLLGFLYADGFVTGKYKGQYKALGVTLSKKDESFLCKIASLLETSVKTSKQGKYEIAKCYKYNPSLVQVLQYFGFSGTKSYDQIDILKHVPNNLLHHFIRGFFDGDGSIYKSEKEGYKNTYAIGFVGMNKVLFKDLSLILSKILNKEVNFRMEKGKYCRIRVKGNPSLIKIRDYLYKDATIFLDRKRDIFYTLKTTNGKFGQIGLSYCKRRDRWISSYKNKYLGIFKTKSEAINSIKKHENETTHLTTS